MVKERIKKMKEAKQIIVVRKDLNMRKGKLAAQVAHASMKVILDYMSRNVYTWQGRDGKILKRGGFTTEWRMDVKPGTPLYEWLNGLFTKIVLYVESEDAIYALENRCRFAEIPCAVVIDSGKTEFHGEPTVTCIAIGPCWADKIDEITGDLPLL